MRSIFFLVIVLAVLGVAPAHSIPALGGGGSCAGWYVPTATSEAQCENLCDNQRDYHVAECGGGCAFSYITMEYSCPQDPTKLPCAQSQTHCVVECKSDCWLIPW